MSSEYLLLGSGGHARSVFSLMESSAVANSLAAVVSLSQDFGVPLSKFSHYSDILLAVKELGVQNFVNGIGLSLGLQARRAISDEAKNLGLFELGVMSNQAFVDPSAILMGGIQIFHKAVVNAGSILGAGTIVNTSCVVEHDVSTGNNCFLGPGALLLGEVKLGSDVLVGAGAIINPGITISDGTTIGSGSVVLYDISEPGTFVGVPARRVKDK